MSNVITEDAVSENINTISDHLEREILQRNFKNFSKNNFLSDLTKTNWESLFS